MAIQFPCSVCGREVKAPDNLAGKKARCPHCQGVVQVPEPIFDAEEVSPPQPPAPTSTLESAPFATFSIEDEPKTADDDKVRRPCPMCGEMIRATAAKCRFCGEIFDETLRSHSAKADPDLVRRFRREIHGLGGVWIFFGVVLLLITVSMSALRGNQFGNLEELLGLSIVFGLLATLWLTAGIFTCLKHLWAVYMGLVICYLSVLGNVLTLVQSGTPNPCGLIIIAAVIFQAHSVLGKASKMKKARIPLTAHPHDLRRKISAAPSHDEND